ncbi:prepilin-type N-terminal cleavage/methylation domain-containing protein [Clostridium sp.]|uniref:prepilin-type N-terminal cleavage/methylation domain-containing protein n=1 Tax=Clostridium sp. TaxID=1506 RepID=UPI00290FB4C1|nr:prepilin-type N-terminal cleavage/methylation domain-containing protein [Clostridium sp.]MDU5107368.1 prepilin-type N-terminal cleavage/methylation domain-containing protein [Clostridium sp.]
MIKNLKKKKGFTLIELIIVIAILAILAAVAIPRLGSMTNKANRSADIASAKSIANAISIMVAEEGTPTPAITKVKLDKASSNEFVKKVASHLQSVPEPKTEDGDFHITVDGSTIKVELVTTGTTPTTTEFFPNVPAPIE